MRKNSTWLWLIALTFLILILIVGVGVGTYGTRRQSSNSQLQKNESVRIDTPEKSIERFADARNPLTPACLTPFGTTGKTLSEIKFAIEKKLGKPTQTMERWKNTHFTTASGEKRRLRVKRDTTSEGEPKIITSLFAVDEEGLPIPISTGESPEDLLKDAAVTETQSAAELKYKDGSTLEIEYLNSEIDLLEIHGPTLSVGCTLLENSKIPECTCF